MTNLHTKTSVADRRDNLRQSLEPFLLQQGFSAQEILDAKTIAKLKEMEQEANDRMFQHVAKGHSEPVTTEADIYKNVGKHRWPYVDEPRPVARRRLPPDDGIGAETTSPPKPLVPGNAENV